MKRKTILATIVVAFVALVSCDNQIVDLECNNVLSTHVEREVEGGRHFNPHSVEAMRKACSILYPTSRNGNDLADEVIVATHKYMRFLPTTKEQMDALLDLDWELFNYPMDYEFPDSVNLAEYHDPAIPEDQITWQYTVIPIDEPIPDTITYQLLEECYLPDDEEEEVETSAGVVNIAQIESLSYELAAGGNGSDVSVMALAMQTYTGTIKVDNTPVKGVKVRMKSGLVVKTTYTSSVGAYSIRGRLGNSPKTEVLFENQKDFKIGYDFQLILPSTMSLGTSRSVNFGNDNNKGWVLSLVNNAAYDYYNWCGTKGIAPPPANMRLWAMTVGGGGAACPMLHHCVPLVWQLGFAEFVEYLLIGDVGSALRVSALLRILLTLLGPDVVLLDVDNADEETIFRNTCHELAHSSHFRVVGRNDLARARWWVNVCDYEVLQGVMNGGDPYGDGTASNCGYAGVTESWAHAIEMFVVREIYYGYPSLNTLHLEFPTQNNGGADADFEKGDYWFKPQIFWRMYNEGIPLYEVCRQLVANASSLGALKYRMLTFGPDEYEDLITEIFDNNGF